MFCELKIYFELTCITSCYHGIGGILPNTQTLIAPIITGIWIATISSVKITQVIIEFVMAFAIIVLVEAYNLIIVIQTMSHAICKKIFEEYYFGEN